MTTDNKNQIKSAGTPVNCEEIGHCFHPGSGIGISWCCRCRKYFYSQDVPQVPVIPKF